MWSTPVHEPKRESCHEDVCDEGHSGDVEVRGVNIVPRLHLDTFTLLELHRPVLETSAGGKQD